MNRRERARVFARIFSKTGGGDGGRPPNRGAKICVTISSHEEIHSSKIQKVLFLLGTYYNLFVVIDRSGVSSTCGDEMEMTSIIKTVRSRLLTQEGHSGGGGEIGADAVAGEECDGTGRLLGDSGEGGGAGKGEREDYKLNPEILPPHRIAFSCTCKGRVAFVRQLGAELILDYEHSVAKELERFGFRVVVYPRTSKGNTKPALGDFLIQ